MSKVIANILSIGMAVVLILLAVESDTILKWFGYGYGVLMFVAVTLSWIGATKSRRSA